MALIRYARGNANPVWRDFDEPFGRLTRFFDEPLLTAGTQAVWTPPMTVTETNEEIVVTAELPGLSESDIQIELENDVLSISGEKAEERTEGGDDRKYHIWERRYGSFRRALTLPRTVEGEAVSAAFDNGVLTVTLPKAAEAKGRRIAISAK